MNKAVVRVLAPVLVILLFLPAGLSAKERRGATLLVTRSDGQLVKGELIAVNPDSLLLLSAGKDVSIGLADLQTVRIARRSKSGTGMLIGGLAGALGGAVWGAANQDSDVWGGGTPIVAGAFAGAIGLAAGALAGVAAGADSTFSVAGKEEAALAAYWNKLRAHSREGRLKGTIRLP